MAKDARDARASVRGQAKEHYDKHAVTLQDLNIGEKVVVQDPKSKVWDLQGVVSKSFHDGRSYEIALENEFKLGCNRRRLRHLSTFLDSIMNACKLSHKWSL